MHLNIVDYDVIMSDETEPVVMKGPFKESFISRLNNERFCVNLKTKIHFI